MVAAGVGAALGAAIFWLARRLHMSAQRGAVRKRGVCSPRRMSPGLAQDSTSGPRGAG